MGGGERDGERRRCCRKRSRSPCAADVTLDRGSWVDQAIRAGSQNTSAETGLDYEENDRHCRTALRISSPSMSTPVTRYAPKR
jgi:hypothetical protein